MPRTQGSKSSKSTKGTKATKITKRTKSTPSTTRKLVQYQQMRDFERTPEPSGTSRRDAAAKDGNRFVVQEHHATSLHWDFRLERKGVLVSWAVPKGIPPHPRENHLAVHTEDHPMSYVDFEGEIPEGEYGGGMVHLWDCGTYDCEKWTEREVMVVLHGERVQGRYVLFQTRGRNWMIHRMDPPADPDRDVMPEDLRPAKPEAGRMPNKQAAWSFETVWGGLRVAVAVSGGRLRIVDVDGNDVTDAFPELGAFGRAVGATEVVVEGELVAIDASGHPSTESLERRLQLKSDSARRRAAQRQPVTFLLADVLWHEGHATTDLSLPERRAILEQLPPHGSSWRRTLVLDRDGTALRRVVREQGLEAVIARPLDGAYGPPRLIPA